MSPDPTFSVSGPSVERYPERQCSTGLLYITVSQDTRPSMAHWRLWYAWYRSQLKCDFRGIRTRIPKRALTEKPYINAAQRASVLSYYATETSWSTSLSWRCVYLHVGLYRFLNAPLVGRYPVIPWYITAQWSSGAQSTFPPVVHWRKMLDWVSLRS